MISLLHCFNGYGYQFNRRRSYSTICKKRGVEVCLKVCKQHLRWSKEFGGITAHTVLYMILAVQHLEEIDDRAIGTLFYIMVRTFICVSNFRT